MGLNSPCIALCRDRAQLLIRDPQFKSGCWPLPERKHQANAFAPRENPRLREEATAISRRMSFETDAQQFVFKILSHSRLAFRLFRASKSVRPQSLPAAGTSIPALLDPAWRHHHKIQRRRPRIHGDPCHGRGFMVMSMHCHPDAHCPVPAASVVESMAVVFGARASAMSACWGRERPHHVRENRRAVLAQLTVLRRVHELRDPVRDRFI